MIIIISMQHNLQSAMILLCSNVAQRNHNFYSVLVKRKLQKHLLYLCTDCEGVLDMTQTQHYVFSSIFTTVLDAVLPQDTELYFCVDIPQSMESHQS